MQVFSIVKGFTRLHGLAEGHISYRLIDRM
jgi:hypothetical protein